MSEEIEFYICTVCFKIREQAEQCHIFMVPVKAGKPGDETRKPLTDAEGRLVTHAPRWFLEASQQVRSK